MNIRQCLRAFLLPRTSRHRQIFAWGSPGMIGFTGTFFGCRCCHEIAEVPPAQKRFNHADQDFRSNWPGDI
jgi:hypothetical protein